MKKILFTVIVLVVVCFIANCSGAKSATTPREAADMYVSEAQSGNVKAVESLSTENYKRRAEKEVGRFQRYSKCTFTKVTSEKESEGTWHAFHYKCEKKGGGIEDVIVAVLENDGSFLVGDID